MVHWCSSKSNSSIQLTSNNKNLIFLQMPQNFFQSWMMFFLRNFTDECQTMPFFLSKMTTWEHKFSPCIMCACHHVLLYDYWLFFMSKGDKIKDLSVEYDEGARLRPNTQSRIMRPLCRIWESQFRPILTQKSN